MIKNKKLLVRLSEDESELAKSEAEKLGISLSAFVRLLLRQWSDGLRFEKRRDNESELTKLKK